MAIFEMQTDLSLLLRAVEESPGYIGHPAS